MLELPWQMVEDGTEDSERWALLTWSLKDPLEDYVPQEGQRTHCLLRHQECASERGTSMAQKFSGASPLQARVGGRRDYCQGAGLLNICSIMGNLRKEKPMAGA